MHSYTLHRPTLTIPIFLLLTACHPVQPVAPPVKPETKSVDLNQKLDQNLQVLAAAARSKDPSAINKVVKERNIALDKGRVSVKLTADKTDNVDALIKLITANKGEVTTHLSVAIFALLPPAAIEPIAADPAVYNITLATANNFPINQ